MVATFLSYLALPFYSLSPYFLQDSDVGGSSGNRGNSTRKKLCFFPELQGREVKHPFSSAYVTAILRTAYTCGDLAWKWTRAVFLSAKTDFLPSSPGKPSLPITPGTHRWFSPSRMCCPLCPNAICPGILHYPGCLCPVRLPGLKGERWLLPRPQVALWRSRIIQRANLWVTFLYLLIPIGLYHYICILLYCHITILLCCYIIIGIFFYIYLYFPLLSFKPYRHQKMALYLIRSYRYGVSI